MSEFINQIEKLLSAVADPEYRYLLLEPLIFYGLLIGVIMLAVGFFTKSPKLKTIAFVVIGLAALAHFPYRDARLAAQPRMEQVYKISSPARVKGFAENTATWKAVSWQFRLLVLCTVATIMIGIDRKRIGYGLTMLTMFLSLLAAKNAIWLNYQDAITYHPNLKLHEAPIDRREIAPPPPAVVRSESERRPSIVVAQPIEPSAPAPSSRSSNRIPPPPLPVESPKARRIQPFQHF
ncbi:MAG: hypothetical protein KA250_09045 [Verrucomicrobiales bacterium]|jgi:hypothetical protein|nr:hypothetical protein [Verrucomicrobiales bacterium]MBP9224243.1 hypothetical protein [Verrucomicrobiales bacterium]HQZ27678.1 hypothetical protein [Verrucomicrobiales bacterium]